MTPRKKDDLHRNLTTVLAAISSVLLAATLTLLINLTSKVNAITVNQAVYKEILNRHELDIQDLKTRSYPTSLANVE